MARITLLHTIMKCGRFASRTMLGLLVALWACALTGCATGGGANSGTPQQTKVPTLRIGDAITVILSGVAGRQEPLRFDDKVKEDGTITLELNQSFKAEGKTALQLQQEIYARYVPDYYRRMTVSVLTADQYYTVTGFVKAPSQYKYVGPIRLTQAIATAGYFTDFGSRKKVILIRASGQRERYNYDKIVDKPELDPQIFPGDIIQVPRRGIFG